MRNHIVSSAYLQKTCILQNISLRSPDGNGQQVINLIFKIPNPLTHAIAQKHLPIGSLITP